MSHDERNTANFGRMLRNLVSATRVLAAADANTQPLDAGIDQATQAINELADALAKQKG